MKKITLSLLLVLVAYASQAQKPKLSIEVFKRDTSFACIASDSNGYVYVGTNGKRIHQYKNGVWNKFSYGLNALISWQRTSIQQMAVRNNTLWVAHAGFIFNNQGDVDYYRYGGIESINLETGPGDKKNYRGQRVVNTDLSIAGPNTRNTVCVFPDTNGRVWSASKYADSVAYPELYNYNARYWYKTGGVGTKEPGATNFYRKETSYPTPLNIGVGTGMPGLENNSIGKRKSSTEITPSPDENEILISCDAYDAVGGLFTAGIMRYDRHAGAYIGKYDEANTGIPFGTLNSSTGPTAMYTDYRGQVWMAFGGGKLARKNIYGWLFIGTPTVLPAGSQFQPHSISGDSKGRIYFGTDNGLLVYDETNNQPFSNSFFNFYNVADGLPSNIVRATHVDKNNNLWLATGNGVCRILIGDLQMFTLKPTKNAFIYNDESKRKIVASLGPQGSQVQAPKVTADGSEATIFKYVGVNTLTTVLKIKEDLTGNAIEMGQLVFRSRDADSLVYSYKHPEGLLGTFADAGARYLTLQVLDVSTTPFTIISENIFVVVRPPVLLMHGLWSNGPEWATLKNYLIANGNYPDYMISNPSYPNDKSFETNRKVAIDETVKLINLCNENGISVGKVDVAGHSMGGVVSRLGLQHPDYPNTYHKLVTFNAVLAGSQVSEYVFSNNALKVILGTVDFLAGGKNINNGALRDLGVTSTGTRVLLNGPGNLNAHIVPSHAIISDFPSLNLTGNPVALISPLNLLTFTIKNSVVGLGPACGAIPSDYNCFKTRVYGGEDFDLVVPISSQQGGLTGLAFKKFDDISHAALGPLVPLSITNSPLTAAHFLNLLKALPTSTFFSTSGYNPPTLNYTGPSSARNTENSETVEITSPVSVASYVAGSTIPVNIVGSLGVNKLTLLTGTNQNNIVYREANAQSHSFSVQIPTNAIGKYLIAVLGSDASGTPCYDTVYINITPPSGVILDSIKILNRNDYKVNKGDSIKLQIKGFYSDLVERDISNLIGASYTFDDVNIRQSLGVANTFTGLLEGYDVAYINFMGKRDTAYFEILPALPAAAGGVLPVNFISFTGRLVNNNAVQLNWATAQEVNNKHFEIEKSFDGINFEKIGTVDSKGYSSNTYNFVDITRLGDKNIYRLKQVDIDGNFTYSNSILIRISKTKEQDILIYPNPSKDYFTLNTTEGNHPKWQLYLTNMFGQRVLTTTIAANQNNVFVKFPALPGGVYSVVIVEELKAEKVYQGKVIISK
jgi:pimeloyl-ACP methyl ester carboxylesterase